MKGLLGEQNPEKIQQIYTLLDDILATNREYANVKNGTYFNYDSVIAKLQEAQTEMTETARNPRPEDLPEDIPWSEKFADPDEDFDPYVFDGSMSEKDYDQRASAYRKDLAAETKLKIRFYDVKGQFFDETEPFTEKERDCNIDQAMQRAADPQGVTAGWAAFEWDPKSETWGRYSLDGVKSLEYDSGRRTDHTQKPEQRYQGVPDILDYLSYMKQQESLSHEPAYKRNFTTDLTLPELSSALNHLDRIRVGLLVDCQKHMGGGDTQFKKDMDEIFYIRGFNDKHSGTQYYADSHGLRQVTVTLSGRDALMIRNALQEDTTPFAKALAHKFGGIIPKELAKPAQRHDSLMML